MKKILLLTGLLLAFVRASAQKKDEISRIQAPLIRFFDAIAANNEEAVKAEATADLKLLETGRVWNMDSLVAVINRYKKLDVKRINHFDFFQTEYKGNVAWLSYYNTASLTFQGREMTVKWLESAVMLKQKDGWKISLLHSTELKPAAPPKQNP